MYCTLYAIMIYVWNKNRRRFFLGLLIIVNNEFIF